MKQLQIILPVHNEEESIEKTVSEIYNIISKKVDFEFIICEDGSRDNTKKVLAKLSKKYPIKLISENDPKGYSRAVIDGFKAATSPFVLVIDSDGQCDPHDFSKFWKLRKKFDVIIGYRKKRSDPWQRIILSSSYKRLYNLLFATPIHDPSCPYVLVQRKKILSLLPILGILREGFWWEFIARVSQAKLKLAELPVKHRKRIDGETRVYTLFKIPKIGFTHVVGIIRIWLNR
ncbi:glycosyltransferase family 2 protein [Candidatus Gottesmanbacteria bacterium]|nr:glycosyltransferase family 2 protein [Candidatus Gottesmanbacteria bacterium]